MFTHALMNELSFEKKQMLLTGTHLAKQRLLYFALKNRKDNGRWDFTSGR